MSSLQRGNVTPSVNFPIDAYATSAATTLNVSAQTIVKAALAGLCGSTSRSLAPHGGIRKRQRQHRWHRHRDPRR